MWTGAGGLGRPPTLGIQPWTPSYGDAAGTDMNGPRCGSWSTSPGGSPHTMAQHTAPACASLTPTLLGAHLLSSRGSR